MLGSSTVDDPKSVLSISEQNNSLPKQNVELTTPKNKKKKINKTKNQSFDYSTHSKPSIEKRKFENLKIEDKNNSKRFNDLKIIEEVFSSDIEMSSPFTKSKQHLSSRKPEIVIDNL